MELSMWFFRLLGWLATAFAGLVAFALFLDDEPKLFEVSRVDNFFRDDGRGIEIVNISRGPITVNGVQVNERPECATRAESALGSRGGDFPMNLKVGDKVTAVGSCRAVRVKILTDRQSFSYTFQ